MHTEDMGRHKDRYEDKFVFVQNAFQAILDAFFQLLGGGAPKKHKGAFLVPTIVKGEKKESSAA